MRSALGTRRAYITLTVVIAIATVVGMFVLWPSGDAPKLRFAEGTPLGQTYSAEVTSITTYVCNVVESGTCEKDRIKVTSGPDSGRSYTVQGALAPGQPHYSSGDSVRVNKTPAPTGALPAGVSVAPYSIVDFERKPPLLRLALIFAALVIVFGRARGAASLVGLAISLVIVLVFVVPAILRDSPPLAVALVGSMAVMLTTIPLAHGLGPKSLAAIAGTASSLVLVVALAVAFTHAAHLTGTGSEEASTLVANNQGISLQALLIAGMVIGALGVLDDVTVSQASTVMALRALDPRQGFGELFRRAIDVGRDHVSATVNTLVLAYVGTSLVTLLILGSGQVGVLDAVNFEVIASVVVATLVGSIGLICAVPITTAFAALLAEGIPAEELAAEGGAAHLH
jgi:uncharacterized membrane protein